MKIPRLVWVAQMLDQAPVVYGSFDAVLVRYPDVTFRATGVNTFIGVDQAGWTVIKITNCQFVEEETQR